MSNGQQEVDNRVEGEDEDVQMNFKRITLINHVKNHGLSLREAVGGILCQNTYKVLYYDS